jgi:ribonucleotide monophosphatase NagD (HAD superfamily)
MLITDLDGTLLDSQGRVSDRNRQAIERARDVQIEVVFATGRSRKVFSARGESSRREARRSTTLRQGDVRIASQFRMIWFSIARKVCSHTGTLHTC